MKPLYIAIFIVLLYGCTKPSSIPKPVGYFRIDLPQPEYQKKEINCPFTFQISKLSRLELFPDSKNPCWFNIAYPKLKAKIHITYRDVDNDLRQYLEEARGLAFEHQIRANRIATTVIRNDSARVFGLVYDLGGSVASQFQFYLTDSVSHFIRGSLYFEARPNPDSLEPSLKYVENDIRQFISSFRWKA